MGMHRYCLVLLLVVFAGLGHERARLKLSIDDKFPIGQQSTGNDEPVKCDGRGNIYVRFVAGAGVFRAPIVKLSPDGNSREVFDALAAPERQKWSVTDFSPADRGELYELAQDADGLAHVLKYSADGSWKASVAIKLPGATLFHLAALPNGTFFVNGVAPDPAANGSKPTTRHFAGIFSSDGEMIKEVALENRSRIRQHHRTTDNVQAGADISLGSAVADEEGTVYVTIASIPVKIYVVSAAGYVRRRFEVSAPFDGASAGTVKVSNSQLAVQFYKPIEGRNYNLDVYRVVNAMTGSPIADYEGLSGLSLSLACFESKAFTFIGPTPDGETIFHATAP